MAPLSRSSMLGWVAAVMAIVSPSQLRPAVSQRMAISAVGAWAPVGASRCCCATGMEGSEAAGTKVRLLR